MTQTNSNFNMPTLFIGIDWADQNHDCHIFCPDGRQVSMKLVHSPEEIDQWVAKMTDLAGDGKIAIMLEQSKGALIHALMQRENIILYPVNPKQLAKYRESYPGGNGKSDPTDAMYLARMLRERIRILKPWRPDDQQTRLLNKLCEQRRQIVASHTKSRQQLISVLKQYFPLALQLFGKSHQEKLLLGVLRRWSDPREFRRADRRIISRVLKEHGIRNSDRQEQTIDTIRTATLLTEDEALITPLALTVDFLTQQIQGCNKAIETFETKITATFNAHPDANLFRSLRGAGPTLAPRLLCAFGSQRDRWNSADDLASYSGIAPVTRQSGKQRVVQRRYACPKFLRQTFHEFADAARKWCTWTRARYKMLKERGMKHHAALRKIARSWIRILFQVWKRRTEFDSERYIENLKLRCPEIIPYLENK